MLPDSPFQKSPPRARRGGHPVQHPGAKRRAFQQAGATARNLNSIRSADLTSVLILKKGYIAPDTLSPSQRQPSIAQTVSITR
jgi:hypothetical protein